MKAIYVFVFSLIFLIGSGCSTVAMLKDPPKVRFKDVRLNDTDLQTALLDIVLEVENRNDVAATIRNLKYNLFVNEKEVAAGVFDQPVKLPANEVIRIAIPVTVKVQDIVSSALNLLQNKGAPYRATGSLRVGIFEIPFSSSGKIDLDKQ